MRKFFISAVHEKIFACSCLKHRPAMDSSKLRLNRYSKAYRSRLLSGGQKVGKISERRWQYTEQVVG